VYTTDKNQPWVANRCSIAARTPVKYLFHNELKNHNLKKMKQIKIKILKTKKKYIYINIYIKYKIEKYK